MEKANLSLDTLRLAKNAYLRCLNASYSHVDNDGDYCVQTDGSTLYLLFQWTHSTTDWISNLDFAAKPYKDMDITWRCHRGFLRVWKSIEPYVKDYIENTRYSKIVVCGYSHGAAIATLAHEYVWYHRPNLRENNLIGFGFGCPRCYFGWGMKDELTKRWEHFYPIRNLNDIVTHVPPVLFGFTHVNTVVKLGDGFYYKDEEHPKYPKCILAHYYQNYLYSLDKAIAAAEASENSIEDKI